MLALNMTMQAQSLVIAWSLTLFHRGTQAADLGCRSFDPKYLAGAYVVLFLSATFCLVYGGFLYAFGIHPRDGLPAWSRDFSYAIRHYNHTALFLGIAVFGPFCEEVFNRGFILQGLARSHGWRMAGFVSSLYWAAMHLQMLALLPIFVLGLMLASLFRRGRSLWPCVIAHMIMNASAFGAQLLNATTKH